jgi:glycosyltransferase involved in cell wall biosynthesis
VSQPPAISVIIPTYNWSAALRCAIRSVLLQTRQDFEILVVGDGCTDDSDEVVAAFGDPRIRWHNLRRNFGSQWAANNIGLTHASADWVAYLGHDDVWYPTHLEAILQTVDATEADLVTSVMILYGPPTSGIRAVAGVFRDGVYHDRDFVPPSALAHRTSLIETIGLWPPAETSVLPVDVAYLTSAVAAGVRIASTNELTVFKFNAAWRRDAYKLKTAAEQHEMLARIETGQDFRHTELLGVLQARSADKLIDITVPDMSSVAPGAVHRANRRFKGVDRRFAATDLRRIDTAERFFLTDVDAGFEWHLEETDERFGPFRWSGPGRRSTVDLPVWVDRDLAIRIHILHAIDPEAVARLELSVNSRRAVSRVELLPSQTFLVHAVVPGELEPPESGLRLTLEVDQVQRPSDNGINPDQRWLGVAVNWIEVEPA